MHETKKFAEENKAPKLSVEELNKKYPGLPQPFTEDTDPYIAGEIASRQAERRKLEITAASGPKGGIYGAGRFGAGLIAHAVDPFELTAAVATGGLAEAGLGATALGKTVGFGIAAKTLPQVFATGLVEGTAANLAIEPFVAMANSQDHTPYSAADGFKNALLGGLTFGALKTAGVGIFRRLNPKQVEMAHNAAAGRLMNDKMPDVSPILKDFEREQAGIVHPDYAPRSPYQFEKLTGVNNKDWYLPKETAETMHTSGESPQIGADLGENGVYLTDNPSVANNIAGSKTLESPGSIHTMSLENAKIKSLGINPNPELVEAARNEGFDGVHYEVNKTGDLEHQPYNAVKIFDAENSKLKQKSVALANDEAVPRASSVEAKNVADHTLSNKSDLFFNEADHDHFEKFINSQEPDYKPTEIEAQAKDLEGQLREQLNQHPDSPGVESALEDIKSASAMASQREKLIKGTIYCLTRGG